MTELTDLQATFGVRYNLTLIGPHGEMKVISSPAVQTITMDPAEISNLPYPKKLNILSNAAEIKLQEVHDSEGYGLWPWEKKTPDGPPSEATPAPEATTIPAPPIFSAEFVDNGVMPVYVKLESVSDQMLSG